MENKFNYILQHFKIIYSIDFPLSIDYGSDSGAKIQIKQGNIAFFETDEAYPVGYVKKEWFNQDIPFFFDDDDQSEVVCVVEDKVVINYDIIASAFYVTICPPKLCTTQSMFHNFIHKTAQMSKHLSGLASNLTLHAYSYNTPSLASVNN